MYGSTWSLQPFQPIWCQFAQLHFLRPLADANLQIQSADQHVASVYKTVWFCRCSDCTSARHSSVGVVQATIDLEMEAKVMEHKKERDLLGRRHMERDNALRKVRKATQFLDSAQNQLPPLRASLHASKVDVAALKKVQSKTALSVVELKKDTDILINSFLKEEKKVREVLE